MRGGDNVHAASGAPDRQGDVRRSLDCARKILFSEKIAHDGYYAFTCEKCASAFGYFGDGETERELLRRAKEIYGRNRDREGS